MFRKKILEKMSTPDSLDQLLVVVTPRAELTLGALTATLVIAVVWSCVAKIPVTVDGRGILLEPRSIRTVQSPGSGQVTDIAVIVGDQVKAGDVLARIDQTEMARPLDQQIARFLSVKRFNERALEQAAEKRDLELKLNSQSLEGNARDIATLTEIREKVKAQLQAVNALQALELAKSRRLLGRMKNANDRQLENVNTLMAEGVVSMSRKLAAESSVAEIENRMGELDVRIKQTELSRLEAEQRDLSLRQELTGLEVTRQQLQIRRQQIEHEYQSEVQRRTQEVEELASQIRLTREKLYRMTTVRSSFSGKILEIAITVGQNVAAGGRVAMIHIDAQEPFHRLELAPDTGSGQFVLAVHGESTAPLDFDASAADIQAALEGLREVRDAKRAIRVTGDLTKGPVDIGFAEPPASEEDDVFLDLTVRDAGLYSIDGVPAFAALTALADRVPEQELKHLGFFPIGQGLKVAPGMDIRVTPSNVERQRYGSIMGKVTEVSPFPVTGEGVANVVGSTDIAKSLVERGGTILVVADLERDEENFSGFKWTSKGPDLRFSAGTTTQCRITVEERRPITFVIPLLRKWFLGEGTKLEPPPGMPAPG